jgi:hypothetical protein
VTGLGMGNANQTVVDSNYGIVYSNIEDMVISLGSGNDTFSINSTVAGTSVSLSIGNARLILGGHKGLADLHF